MRQRLPERHPAVPFLVEIIGLVSLVVEHERRRLVDHLAHRRQNRPAARDRRPQGRRVHERFERRARLPHCQRAVQLAEAVRASPHQRPHLAGVRIHRHQRHLRFGILLPPLRQLRVDFLHPDAHRLHRLALQLHVQRRVDAVLRRLKIDFREALPQFVVDQVHEVRRVGRLDAALGQLQRCLGRFQILHVRQITVLVHQPQHDVAPLQRPILVPVRVVQVRLLDHARQQRRLLHLQLAHVLAEVHLRRLAEAPHGECAPLPQVHLIGVVLENLLLGQLLFNLQGDHRFGDFAPPRLLRTKPEVARQLHAQGRGALRLAPFAHVLEDRLDNTQRIESGVLEEPFVLGRRHRIHQHPGNVAVANHAALLPLPVEQVADQLGLKLVDRPFAVVAVRHDPLDHAVLEKNHPRLASRPRVHARENLHPVRTDLIPAHAAGSILRVAAPPQQFGQFGRAQ